MSIVNKPYTFSPGAVIVAAEHNANFDTLYNLVNGGIDTSNLSPSAAIALSQISFTTALVMSSAIINQSKGADVASAAGNITLGNDGNFFDITGVAAITSITAKAAGTVVTLQFDSTASLVDGSNLKLNGNFQGAAESTITLVTEGTNWFEIARSPLTSVTAATQAEQETGSSTAVYTSPGRQQFHPSAAKAWAQFDGSTVGTNAPTAGYNVTSITRNSVGNYTVNLATGFSSANFCFIASASVSGNEALIAGLLTKHATAPVMETTNGGGTLVDADKVSIVMFGDFT